MSVVIGRYFDRQFSHFVRTNDGTIYYVDSCNTFDRGYETMVFAANEELKVTNWNDLYAEWYNSFEEMQEGHNRIINHLEYHINGRED